jgi:hypothetical protein
MPAVVACDEQIHFSTWVNLDKSAANFCHQVAAYVSHIFGHFYLVKNHKIANNSTTA